MVEKVGLYYLLCGFGMGIRIYLLLFSINKQFKQIYYVR